MFSKIKGGTSNELIKNVRNLSPETRKKTKSKIPDLDSIKTSSEYPSFLQNNYIAGDYSPSIKTVSFGGGDNREKSPNVNRSVSNPPLYPINQYKINAELESYQKALREA